VIAVHGVNLDEQTRCAHWRSPLDVVAIKFVCCGKYYACHECHRELESHESVVWPRQRFGEPAVLCGVCRTELSVDTYLSSTFECPFCAAGFNPGCADHYHLYFER
jgi:uncharacterized CHY-type Zn-finger protein